MADNEDRHGRSNTQRKGDPNRNPSKGTEQILKTLIAKIKRSLKLHTEGTHCIPENTDPEEPTTNIFWENIYTINKLLGS